MSDLGNFLNKASGKVVNGLNTEKNIKCLGDCGGKITKHIPISYSDLHGGGKLHDEIFSSLADYVPGSPVSIGNPYACSKCRKIRFNGGILSSLINKDDHGYL